jgi:hydrogenase expression/formation protein HypE
MKGEAMKDVVKLSHGAGGILTKNLVEDIFLKYFKSKILLELGDSAVFNRLNTPRIAFTTDSYVVSPLFFPGGDIGKLFISGTINDLVAVGAKPLYISAGFIIEEGLPFHSLERIVRSMSETAERSNVQVVAADTKVVEHGKGDGIFINTAGIGETVDCVLGTDRIRDGDVVIVNGTMGDHGAAIMLSRKRDELKFESQIKSDCASLDEMLLPVYEKFGDKVHWARDVTRGGLFTILNEGITDRNLEIVVRENDVPLNPEVKSVCELLGLDPFYLANEGKIALVVDSEVAVTVVDLLRAHEHGRNATVIGKVRKGDGKVYVETPTGGLRIADSLLEDPVPRIC